MTSTHSWKCYVSLGVANIFKKIYLNLFGVCLIWWVDHPYLPLTHTHRSISHLLIKPLMHLLEHPLKDIAPNDFSGLEKQIICWQVKKCSCWLTLGGLPPLQPLIPGLLNPHQSKRFHLALSSKLCKTCNLIVVIKFFNNILKIKTNPSFLSRV